MERSRIPLWDGVKGQRLTTVEMIEKMVRIAGELGRPIATAAEARRITTIGASYDATGDPR